MRRRQITTVEWGQQRDTNIPTGWAFYPKRHLVTNLQIVSGHNRKAHIKVAFSRGGYESFSNEQINSIRDRLRNIKIGIIPRFVDDDHCFHMTVTLGQQEEFCYGAVRIGRLVMETLGSPDIPELFCQFSITQETEVYLRGRWMSFADHVRLKHGLPLPSEFRTSL